MPRSILRPHGMARKAMRRGRRGCLATTLLVLGRLVDVLLRVVLHVARVLLRVAHLPLRAALGLRGPAVRVQRVFDAVRRVRRVVLHVLHRVAFCEHRERKADGQRGDDPFPHSIPPGKCRPDGRRSSGKLRTRCPLHNDPEENRVTVPSAGCWPARACRTESASPRASACRSAAPSRRRAATTCRDRCLQRNLEIHRLQSNGRGRARAKREEGGGCSPAPSSAQIPKPTPFRIPLKATARAAAFERAYALKLDPQPQVCFAFGFLKLNPLWPNCPST